MSKASNGRVSGSSIAQRNTRRSFLKVSGLAATGGLAGLAGCSGDSGKKGGNNGGMAGSSKNQKATIKYAIGTIHDQSAADKFEKRVNEKIPDDISFKMTEIPGSTDQDTQKLKTWLSSGRADPDIFNLDGIYTQQFAAAGWLLPIKIISTRSGKSSLSSLRFAQEVGIISCMRRLNLLTQGAYIIIKSCSRMLDSRTHRRLGKNSSTWQQKRNKRPVVT